MKCNKHLQNVHTKQTGERSDNYLLRMDAGAYYWHQPKQQNIIVVYFLIFTIIMKDLSEVEERPNA